MNLFFDIGCNVGDFTRACYRKYPECKVIAVDANLEVLKRLPKEESLVKLNKLVGDGAEDVKFNIDPYQTGASTASKKWMSDSRFQKGSKYLHPENVHWKESITLNSITLDSLVGIYGKPDYIKIDVEGYEYEVISGLTEKQKGLCFEWVEEDLGSLDKVILMKTLSSYVIASTLTQEILTSKNLLSIRTGKT